VVLSSLEWLYRAIIKPRFFCSRSQISVQKVGVQEQFLNKAANMISYLKNDKKCYIMSQDRTRIPVSTDTREDLKSRGSKGDTYDDVIQDLIQNLDNKTAEGGSQ
jgi:hypothetical protein